MGALLVLGGLWAAVVAGAQAPPAPSSPPPAPGPGASAPARPAGAGGGEVLRIFIVNAPPEARTGRWDPRAGVWEFEPPAGAWVRAEWGDWQAQARKLRWQAAEQVAELVGEVSVRRPDMEATAARATVRVSERRSRLEGDVRAVQFAAGEGARRPLRTLTAQSVEIDDAQQQLTARQSVRVEQAEPAFWARGDELTYSSRTGKLVLLARSGIVGEAQGYRLAQAPRLEYDVNTGELVLFGPASLQQTGPGGS